MRAKPFALFRASVFTLVGVVAASCSVDSSPTSSTEQDVVNPPLPPLSFALFAKNTVSIGALAQVNGDVGAAQLSSSVLFDTSSFQSPSFNTVAVTVQVNTSASVGRILGDDITVNGTAASQTLGLDPTQLPAIPAVTASTPGTTNVSTNANQTKQLCPGQYGTISLAANSTLNLNGGVYQISKLTLADGAKLQPSEPVVILVSGALNTGTGSVISPFTQLVNPMTASDIRIETGGAITIGDSNVIRAHLLATGKLTTGTSTQLTGAAWAKAITIGAQSTVTSEDVFALRTPPVAAPCNDNNACTVDECVGGGTAVAFCRNTPTPAGSSCSDGNFCNGDELCDGAGTCQRGTPQAAGASCSDGNECNGDETCNGTGSCLAGTPPVIDDQNSCTADLCDATTGDITHTPLPDGTACNGVGVCQTGVCSITPVTLFMINDDNGHLEQFDPDTGGGTVTDVGPLGVPYAFGDCAFNPDDGQLYMVDGRGNFGLYRLSTSTGAASLVGLDGVSAMEGLAFDTLTHTMYVTSIDEDEFFSISTSTGVATPIGPINPDFQGLVWDSKRNMLVGFNGSQLFSIDVATGATTSIGSGGFVTDFGMTYDAARDRYWVVDFNGNILELDPNNGFATEQSFFVGSGHTGIAAVPVRSR